MDWVVSLTSLICIELTLRRKWYAWVFSLVNQFIWLTFILLHGQYGLLPMNMAMFIQSIRGIVTWYRLKGKNTDDRSSKTASS